MNTRDTTPDASEVRTTLYRRMSTDERSWIAAELSNATRAIALVSIQRRHPEYTAHEARMALYRLLVGDDLFQRAWPSEPVLSADIDLAHLERCVEQHWQLATEP